MSGSLFQQPSTAPINSAPISFEGLDSRGKRLELADQVQKAYVELCAQEMATKLSDPTLKEQTISVLLSEVSSMMDEAKKEFGPLVTKRDIEQTLRKAKDEVSMKLSTPEGTLEFAREHILGQFYTEAKLQLLLDSLNEIAADSDLDISQDIRNARQALAPVISKNTKFLNRLIDIAEVSGLETAGKEETVFKVLREFHPTPEDYIASDAEDRRIKQEFCNSLISIVPKFDQDIGGKMMRLFANTIEAAIKMYEPFRKQDLELKLSKIYQ